MQLGSACPKPITLAFVVGAIDELIDACSVLNGSAPDASTRGRAELAACVGLFVAGVYATSFGPALPVLARDLAVSLDTAGLLLTVFFSGSILSAALVAIWWHRYDPRLTAVVGLIGAALGFASLGAVHDWPKALGAVLVTGLGDGLLVAGVHLVIARTSIDVARGMNRLNLYFAFGAIAGPLWSGALLEFVPRGRLIAFCGIALLVGAAALFAALAPSPYVAREADASAHRDGNFGVFAWCMGAVLFLYVGAEFGLGSWVATYSASVFNTGLFIGGVVSAVYWGALMLGRLLSGWLFAAGWAPMRVLLISIGGALMASAGIVLSGEMFIGAVGAAFATGLCLGPIWPAVLSIVAARSGGGAPAAIVTIGNAGGVFFPWLQGWLIVQAGARAGMAMAAVLCVVMLLIALSALWATTIRLRRSVVDL